VPSRVVEKVRAMFKITSVKRILARVRGAVSSDRFLYLAVIVYIAVLSTVTILRNSVFLTSGFDLGIFNQAFHTTLFDGKLFYETGDLSFNPGGSFFGVHFSPMLFLLLPFYAIYPSVEILLVMQSAILAFGAFPIYWMTRDKLGKNLALGLSIIYLAYPPLIFVNLNNFHLEAFASTFFLFSIYYLELEKWPKFFLFFVLALITIEFAPIIGIFVAVYALILYLKKRNKHSESMRKHIAIIASVGLISILYLVLALQTKARVNTFTSPIPTTFPIVSLNPTEWYRIISYDFGAKMLYIISLFGPIAFLSFLAPEPLVMALPWIIASLISSYSFYHSIYYQYNSFVIPFIFVALPKAIERLHFPQTKRILQLLLLCTVIFGLYLIGSKAFLDSQSLPTNDRAELVQKILPLIPPGASVLTENDIFPHVSNRLEAYMYMPTSTNVSVDYILVDIASGWYAWWPDISGERIPTNVYTEIALKSGDYGVLASAKSVLLLEKSYTGEPAIFVPYVSTFNYETLNRTDGSIVEDPTSTSRLVLRGEKNLKDPLWYGPYIALLPGLYSVTYVVRVDDALALNPSNRLLAVDVAASEGTVSLAKEDVYGVDAPLGGGWFNVTLLLGLTTPAEGVEFRGFVVGDNSIYLDYLVVKQLSPQPSPQPINELKFNFENLYLDQGTISEGVMTHSGGAGTFWFGPYASLPKGNYTAKFWLRLDKPYDGPLINIGVSTNIGKNLLNYSTVYSFDFNKMNMWQSFEVNFVLPNDSNGVEFPGLNVRQFAPVSFALVEVYPDTRG
jgi:uncharacterized membrane protein